MQNKTVFRLALAGSLILLAAYGWMRFRLGIDLTDEGAHLAWPLRIHLGEAPHAAELLTLVRPIEVHLALLYDLRPGLTLLEFRLAGWAVHLAAFATLATFLFRLGAPPLRSLLTAAVPLFVGHIFGLATPSYNTLSSDGLTIALGLLGLVALDPAPGYRRAIGAGIALFVATLAHPGLGLVALLLIGDQVWRGGLAANLGRRTLTPLNAACAVFVACWVAYGGYFWAAGHLARWLGRLAFARSAVTAGESLPLFLAHLLAFPFTFNPLAAILAGAVVAASLAARLLAGRLGAGGHARHAAAFAAVAALVVTFSLDTENLPLGFAMVALVMAAVHGWSPFAFDGPGRREVHLLLLASVVAALAYAALTNFFTYARSWTSGVQALPFAFATGLTLLLNRSFPGDRVWKLLVSATLALAVLGAARNHYRFIYRDGAPRELVAGFTVPKLRGIRSTPERVAALNALYARLRDDLRPGDRLVAFDDCPFLYYLFDARPAYGLAWAARYGQSLATLARLDAEFTAGPLPRYAIRALVDVGTPAWRDAPRTRFEHYPLNETVRAHYELIHTIFPFEIWRLRPAAGEKTSPAPSPR